VLGRYATAAAIAIAPMSEDDPVAGARIGLAGALDELGKGFNSLPWYWYVFGATLAFVLVFAVALV
jgi:hypothetical protein